MKKRNGKGKITLLFVALLAVLAFVFVACADPGTELVPAESVVISVRDNAQLTLTSAGATLQLDAVVSPVDTTDTLTWTSSNPAVATVSNTGVVTALAGTGSRTTSITASAGEVTSNAITVTVNIPPGTVAPTGITITRTGTTGNLTAVGATATFTATVAPQDADYDPADIVWASSNMAAATMNNGTITAVATGVTNISATIAGHTSNIIQITVQIAAPDIPVTAVTITGGDRTITDTEESLTLQATVEPNNATNQTVTWASSNPAVATINTTTGAVSFVANGTTTITATSADGPSDSIELTVDDLNLVPVYEVRVSSAEDVTNLAVRGASLVFSAEALCEQGNPLTREIIWTATLVNGDTLPANVATFDAATQTLTVAANAAVGAANTVRVTASAGSQSDHIDIEINVARIAVDSVTIQGDRTITVSDASEVSPIQFSVEVGPNNTTDATTVTWSIRWAYGFSVPTGVELADVASISVDGSLTIFYRGEIEVVATSTAVNTVHDVIRVNITDTDLVLITGVDISIYNNQAADLSRGETLQFEAEVQPGTASQDVIWNLKLVDAQGDPINGGTVDNTIATISNEGLFTVVETSVGTWIIEVTATAGTHTSKAITVTIENGAILAENVEITGAPTTPVTQTGDHQLSALVTAAGEWSVTDTSVTWSLRANAAGGAVADIVATISVDGLLTIVGSGTFQVVATANDGSNQYGYVEITVNIAVVVESIVIARDTGPADLTIRATAETITFEVDEIVTSPAGETVAYTWHAYDASTNGSPSTVVTISEQGVVSVQTDVRSGTAWIFAMAGGVESNRIQVHVNIPIPVETVTIDGEANRTVTDRQAIVLSAIVAPENATNRTVSWSVTEGANLVTTETLQNGDFQVTVSAGVSSGTVVIVATADGVSSNNVTLTINIPIPVESLEITNRVEITGNDDRTLLAAHALTVANDTLNLSDLLQVQVLPSGANSNFNWSLGAEGIVSINNGTVTAIANGTVRVTLTSVDNNAIYDWIYVVVAIPTPATGISIQAPSSTEITDAGGTIALTALPEPGTTTYEVSWEVSNSSVLQLSHTTGRTTTVSVVSGTTGEHAVTVTARVGEFLDTIEITVDIPEGNQEAEEWERLREWLSDQGNQGGSFTLQSDVDASATEEMPFVATIIDFRGTLDGAGFTIRNLRTSRTADAGSGGLFRTIGEVGATIRNLIIEDSFATATVGNSGFLAGQVMGGGTTLIDNVNFTWRSTGVAQQGGLIGTVTGVNTVLNITNSTFNVTFIGTGNHAGGLFGDIASSGRVNITNSSVQVTEQRTAGEFRAGIVGRIAGGGNLTVSDSDIGVQFRGNSTNNRGGIVGESPNSAGTTVLIQRSRVDVNMDHTFAASFAGGITSQQHNNIIIVRDSIVNTVFGQDAAQSGGNNRGGVVGRVLNGSTGTTRVENSEVNTTFIRNTGTYRGGVIGAFDNTGGHILEVVDSVVNTSNEGTGAGNQVGGVVGLIGLNYTRTPHLQVNVRRSAINVTSTGGNIIGGVVARMTNDSGTRAITLEDSAITLTATGGGEWGGIIGVREGATTRGIPTLIMSNVLVEMDISNATAINSGAIIGRSANDVALTGMYGRVSSLTNVAVITNLTSFSTADLATRGMEGVTNLEVGIDKAAVSSAIDAILASDTAGVWSNTDTITFTNAPNPIAVMQVAGLWSVDGEELIFEGGFNTSAPLAGFIFASNRASLEAALTNPTARVALTADIDMGGVDTATAALFPVNFAGTLWGGGFTISNFTARAMFNGVTTAATVERVAIIGSFNAGNHTGAMVTTGGAQGTFRNVLFDFTMIDSVNHGGMFSNNMGSSDGLNISNSILIMQGTGNNPRPIGHTLTGTVTTSQVMWHAASGLIQSATQAGITERNMAQLGQATTYADPSWDSEIWHIVGGEIPQLYNARNTAFSIEIVQPNSTVFVGDTTYPLTLSARFPTLGLTQQQRAVSWRSQHTDVATVNTETGVVTAVAPGVAIIEVLDYAGEPRASITVTVAAATQVTITTTARSVEMGQALQLDAEANRGTISWYSATPSVLTINETTGEITPLTLGNSVVTATTVFYHVDGRMSYDSDSVTIEVVPAAGPATLARVDAPDDISVIVGESVDPFPATVTGHLTDGTTRDINVAWDTTNAEIDTDTRGTTLVTATATYEDTSLEVSFTVTVTWNNTGFTAITNEAGFLAMTASGRYYLANDITITAAGGTGVVLAINFTGHLHGNGFRVTIENTFRALFNNVTGLATIEEIEIVGSFNIGGAAGTGALVSTAGAGAGVNVVIRNVVFDFTLSGVNHSGMIAYGIAGTTTIDNSIFIMRGAGGSGGVEARAIGNIGTGMASRVNQVMVHRTGFTGGWQNNGATDRTTIELGQVVTYSDASWDASIWNITEGSVPTLRNSLRP